MDTLRRSRLLIHRDVHSLMLPLRFANRSISATARRVSSHPFTSSSARTAATTTTTTTTIGRSIAARTITTFAPTVSRMAAANNVSNLPGQDLAPGQAKIIDGTALAKSVRADVANRIAEIKATNKAFQPHLVIVQVGADSASSTYIRMKRLAAEECGMKFTHKHLPDGASEVDIVQAVKDLNEDPAVDGVLVQLPLGAHIDAEAERRVTEAVSPSKDVDGFHALNIGHLSSKACNPQFVPCTPAGVMKLLEVAGLNDLSGLRATVIGRSDIVGNPVTSLLRARNCTVTQVHSRTKDLPSHLKDADILVAAMGKAHFVKGEWLKSGVIVIDVGTNYIPDASKKSGQRLVGDVDAESAAKVAAAITPVPGGVGPMTVAMLMENVFQGALASLKARNNGRGRGVVSPNPIKPLANVPADIEVARSQKPKPIDLLAREIGLVPSELEPYGDVKAKVNLDVLKRLAHRKDGKYIVVAGITPTPLGEGKSTTTIGLAQALGAHLAKPTFACVRQPSQGPTFGIKGGAAGGGYSQVIPMEEFNLHLTGDNHAVQAANNLLAAALDARMFHEATQKDGPLFDRLCPKKKGVRSFAPVMFRRLKKLGIDKTNPDDLTEEEKSKWARLDIDPETITWNRVTDTNDRYLREIEVGLSATEKGISRKTAYDIAVASECMAVLALANDLKDMRERLGRMVVCSSKAGDPITADDLGIGGALTVLMKDAIKPNLMQTMEGTPVFVHAGPFANIAHGNSSILADRVALKLAGLEEGESDEQSGYVITEAGFGADIGMEKFCNIKCRESGLVPDAVVLVATVRALKSHGGGPEVSPGKPLHETYQQENLEILEAGARSNLAKHISNAKKYGLKVVVAVNKFTTDTDAELELVRKVAMESGADEAVAANHWALGGAGAVDLAQAVIRQLEGQESQFKFLYDINLPLVEKIEIIAKEMYGAAGISIEPLAAKQLEEYTRQGFSHLPICMAKTPLSLSHDPALKGAPTGFTIPIREAKLSAGAGFIYPQIGTISTMPGLSTRPGFFNIDLDPETGEVVGLS